MVKNLFISVISQEEKKMKIGGPLNFKYSVSPIRYVDLLPIWNCTEKIIYLREVYVKFWENVNGCWLIYRVCYKELISQLDIQEPKTR